MATTSTQPAQSPTPRPGVSTVQLITLFAVLYFMQGISEVSDGLTAQPIQSLLKGWGRSPAEITGFVTLISLPWALKAVFGLLVDFVPLGGSRRRNYLLLTTGICSVLLLALGLHPPPSSWGRVFTLTLFIVNAMIAASDVATDALMVDVGRETGLTGRLQSVQWTALFSASMLGSYLGGHLSRPGQQRFSLLLSGLCALAAFGVVRKLLRDEQPFPPPQNVRAKVGIFAAAFRSPRMLSVSAFLLLWSLNPLSQALLYGYMTGHLKVSEVFYGKTLMLQSLASLLASAAYGLYCHRLSPLALVHGSIGLGIVGTLLYLGLGAGSSVMGIVALSLVVGFVYQTASIAQSDLAARVCPHAIAGTGFALFMSLSNLSSSMSVWLGGLLYERLLPQLGPEHAFRDLLIVGAVLNASCWLLLPWLKSALRASQQVAPET